MKRPVHLAVGLSLMVITTVLLFRVVTISLILPPRHISTARVIPPQSAFTTPEREVQIILASRTLYPVITNLNLNKLLAEQFKSEEPLPVDVSFQFLKRDLDVSVESEARIIRIQASSENGVQAMTVANEIAKVYVANAGAGASILEQATPSIRPVQSTGKYVTLGILLLLDLTGCGLLVAGLRRKPTVVPALPKVVSLG